MARAHSPYRLSRLAQSDLASIYDYTCQQWSVDQADAYYARLVAGFEALADGSRIGHDAELGHGVLKILVGSHMIFYQTDDTGIAVVRILHQAMDAPRHLDI